MSITSPSMSAAIGPIILEHYRNKSAMWGYRPQWYWHGWDTLLPIGYGHDEYARRVLVIGWIITGRICIPLWGCGDPECLADAIAAAACHFIDDNEVDAS